MAARTCAGVMPTVIAILPLPLIVKVPPLATLAGRIVLPVTVAGASGESAAPVPVIFAAAGGPATGLAMKFEGLSNSERGMLASWPDVSG
jgi:hypothetical protein